MNLRPSLRKTQDEIAYMEARAAGKTRPLDTVFPLCEWKYWKLIPNEFGYSAAYKTSHMLLTKEDAPDWDDLTEKAKEEYFSIRREFILSRYEQIVENCTACRSIKNLYHKHLVEFYDTRSEMGF